MTQNIIDEVIQAPANEKVQLAELLLESIEHSDGKINQLWIEEVRRRMLSVKNGKTKLIDFAGV
jgi:hypothetical protein